MHVRLYTEASVFEQLAEAWQDLMGRATIAPIFMTIDYQKLWWQHLGVGELRILAVYNEADLLVGLAPLLLDGFELRTVGCVDVSDYLDFLVDRDYQDSVYPAIVDYLADQLGDTWQSTYFCSLPHHSPTRERMLSLAEAKGWSAQAEVEEVCPIITLADTWDGYLATVNKKQRHEIRRKLRRAEGGAETRWFVLETSDALTDTVLDTFIDLHQKSSAKKEDFWNDDLMAFFKALAKRMTELGYLKLYFVEMDGQLTAALLCFDYQNEILVYNSGFDPTQFQHLSPGNIIISYSIQHAIDLGRGRYDFLRGDEVYKFRFGAMAEDVFNLRLKKEVELEDKNVMKSIQKQTE